MDDGTEIERAAHLRVLNPGWCSLIVDRGRLSSRALGVPVGGAADRAAWMLGNALVGNPPEAAALEMTLTGPTLQTDADIACVVCGAAPSCPASPPATWCRAPATTRPMCRASRPRR